MAYWLALSSPFPGLPQAPAARFTNHAARELGVAPVVKEHMVHDEPSSTATLATAPRMDIRNYTRASQPTNQPKENPINQRESQYFRIKIDIPVEISKRQNKVFPGAHL